MKEQDRASISITVDQRANSQEPQRSECMGFDMWLFEGVELDQFHLVFERSLGVLAFLRSTVWRLR